jgi:hypothetical protein
MWHVCVTNVTAEKQYILHMMSVCVAAVFQHAKRMRYVIFPSVAVLDLQHFSALSHNNLSRYSGKKVIKHKICILIFSTRFIRKTSHAENKSTRYCHKCENVFM